MSETKTEPLSFNLIDNPKILKPILRERHPYSCFVYNQVVISENLKDDLKFYTLGKLISSSSWIVVDYIRKDYGHNFSVSPPTSIASGKEQIPAEIKDYFTSGGGIIKWDEEGFVFLPLEKSVSAMIVDISVNIKGNITEIHPCILYYLENAAARNLSISWNPEVNVRRLTPKDSEFIASTWKYTTNESEDVFRKALNGNPSAGVFIGGKCIAGVVMPGNGLISALYTLKQYRGQGYGKLAMKYIFKECAKDGCVPCSSVEVKNSQSIAFHDTLGAKPLCKVDFVDIKKRPAIDFQ